MKEMKEYINKPDRIANSDNFCQRKITPTPITNILQSYAARIGNMPIQMRKEIESLKKREGGEYQHIVDAGKKKDTSKDHHDPKRKKDRPIDRVEKFANDSEDQRINKTLQDTINRKENELDEAGRKKKPDPGVVAQLRTRGKD